MPDKNGQMSQMDLIKKVMIILCVVELFFLVFGYFVGTNQGPSGVSNPALIQLAGIQNSTVKTANSLAGVFTTQTISIVTCTGFFCSNPLNTISNIIGTLVNVIWGFFQLVYYLLLLMGYNLYIVIFLLFGVLPSLFTVGAFGFLGPIFSIVYGFITFILISYGIYLIAEIVKPFIPLLSG